MNKAIIEECESCRYCDLEALHKGCWYCEKINVFSSPVDLEGCAIKRKHGAKRQKQ